MIAREKLQCPVRLSKADYEKIRELAAQQGLSYQKVAEILLLNYMRGNKQISLIVEKYAEQRKSKKGRTFDDTERGQILEELENVSPLKNLEGR